MGSATEATDESVTPCDDDLRAIHLQLEVLAQMTTDYPLQCSLGTCDFLFESRDEIEILVESLTEELSHSRMQPHFMRPDAMGRQARRSIPALGLAWLVAWPGCGSSVSDRSSALVAPEAGGTVQTTTGVALEVPSGAVAQDTTIDIAPMTAPSWMSTFITGVRFEPDGLVFAIPATLRLPLLAVWSIDNPPIHLEFEGSNPDSAYETGLAFTVTADGKTAELAVSHFSGAICATNCHAGTYQFVEGAFSTRGQATSTLTNGMKAKYPNVPPPTNCATPLGSDAIQSLLDTYFQDVNGYDEGVDVPSTVIQQMIDAATAGRIVILAFKKGSFGARGGASNFYSAIAHTAVVEFSQGQWRIRNVVVAGPEVLAALGGTNLAYWPLSDLNGFRRALSGVPVEMQACGAPGCLAGLYAPLSVRSAPWTAVRIYVESEGNSTCVPRVVPASCTCTYPDDFVGDTVCRFGNRMEGPTTLDATSTARTVTCISDDVCTYQHFFDNCPTSGAPTALCCGDDFSVQPVCVGLSYDAAGWNPITCCQ